MNKLDWLEVFKCIFNSTDSFVLYQGNRFDYQYIGDPSSRIGYLQVWSFDLKVKTHVSRLIIPEGQQFLSFKEAESFYLPDDLIYEVSF